MSMLGGLWSASQQGELPSSVGGGASVLLTVPAYLWHLYVEYLWHYERHSWILSASATFKLLALITIMPFIILSLLDVGAYVIARTLGVVETTKASTSDTKRPAESSAESSDGSESETIQVGVGDSLRDGLPPDSAAANAGAAATHEDFNTASRFGARLEIPTPQYPYIHRGLDSYGPEVEACFFSPSDERQLELGGALLSSPTPSRQASPALDRRQRMQPLTAISPTKNTHSDRTERLKTEANSTSGTRQNQSADSEKENILLDGPESPALRRRAPAADSNSGSED